MDPESLGALTGQLMVTLAVLWGAQYAGDYLARKFRDYCRLRRP